MSKQPLQQLPNRLKRKSFLISVNSARVIVFFLFVYRQPNNNQSLLIANQPVVNQEETITVYPAPESEHANALPQQVVRQMVVTDNKMPGQALPNQQLQLPQRPMPPNMPKPMPAKVDPYLVSSVPNLI